MGAVVLEVCVDSVASAVQVAQAGADRIELCSALLEGGLTPTPGLLKAVKEAVGIPVFCMVRPRIGDFVYAQDELQVMHNDIEILKAAGADGIVVGVVTQDGKVNVQVTKHLVQSAFPLPVTFHRAIDHCVDLVEAVRAVAETGAKRILTSGGERTALEGLDTLRQLVATKQVRIIVAGGVRAANVRDILKTLGKDIDLHSSGGRVLSISKVSYRNPRIVMGHPQLGECEYDHYEASASAVTALRSAIDVEVA